MERRLGLALILSMMVIWIWANFLVPKPYPIENKEEASKMDAQQKPLLPPISESKSMILEPDSFFEYDLGESTLVFDEVRASLRKIIFKDPQNYIYNLYQGFLLSSESLGFKKELGASNNKIVFVYRDNNKEIKKQFSFSCPYSIELDVIVENMSNLEMDYTLPLILGILDYSFVDLNARYQDVAIVTENKTLRQNGQKNLEAQFVKFMGIRDRYYCAIIEPISSGYIGFVKKLNTKKSEVGLRKNIKLGPKQKIREKFRIYLGPQDLNIISQIKSEWAIIINYGIFDFISQLILQWLRFLYSLFRSWGIAIIILSISVYFLLYPLSLKQLNSMRQMQKLQPKIEELRKFYNDNPQRLNKEILELYKQHKVNPFGGCLPLFLQMPIFIALYQALMRSVLLRGASFLWIKDLSAPDRLFILPTSLPFIKNEINILPIIMCFLMIIQQKISMATASTANEQQKMMMFIFPLLFGLIFYQMPSGLVLYWLINSFLMVLFQIKVNYLK